MTMETVKLSLLTRVLLACVVLFCTAAFAQKTIAAADQQSSATQAIMSTQEPTAAPEGLAPAPTQELVAELAEEPAVAPECTKFSRLRLDVALAKSSRVDNDLFDELKDKMIRNIEFKAIDVFDKENEKENNKLYLFFNRLHFTTRRNTVEPQLLFKTGDKVDLQDIQESERILRSRKYFTNAYILPESVCGNQVDLLVVTQDAWVLEPQFSFSHKSGDTQSGFGISDGNILGTGNAVSITYSENEQRNGVSYQFSNPYFFNKQISVSAEYEDTSDGRNSLIDVSRPFYALHTPWATGVHLEEISLIDQIRSRGEVVNEFRHQNFINEIFYGKATDINADFTQRWLIGFTNEEQKFYSTVDTVQGIPIDDQSTYPWVEYQYLESKFGIYKNINQIQRTEDIALGKNFSFRLGFGGRSLDNPDDVIRFKGKYSHVFDFSDLQILEYEMKIDGRQHLHISDLDPVILTTHISYNHFENEKNRWYARLDYDIGHDIPQYEELTVGGITGLRGYPVDFSRGKKRYVLTIERRHFSDVHIFNLLRVGGVVFFDMGKAWGLEDQPYAEPSRLLTDVGVGLRLSSTKVRVGNVVHIDVAMPTSAKNGISKYQLTIGAEAKF
jgi:hypothetical protein